jgi:hypothetical protein
MQGLLIYVTRILRPIWKKPLLNILALNSIENLKSEKFSKKDIEFLKIKINEVF